MRTLKLIISVALILTAAATHAQTIMIRGATVHTMDKAGVLEDTDVFISGGEIRSIGRGLTVPQDIMVFEAGGRPLTPGFFAGISNIGTVEVSAVGESSDGSLALKEMRPEFDVAPAFNPNSSTSSSRSPATRNWPT